MKNSFYLTFHFVSIRVFFYVDVKVDNISKWIFRKLNSNATCVRYIILRENSLSKGMNLSPPHSYGLNRKTCIWKKSLFIKKKQNKKHIVNAIKSHQKNRINNHRAEFNFQSCSLYSLTSLGKGGEFISSTYGLNIKTCIRKNHCYSTNIVDTILLTK